MARNPLYLRNSNPNDHSGWQVSRDIHHQAIAGILQHAPKLGNTDFAASTSAFQLVLLNTTDNKHVAMAVNGICDNADKLLKTIGAGYENESIIVMKSYDALTMALDTLRNRQHIFLSKEPPVVERLAASIVALSPRVVAVGPEYFGKHQPTKGHERVGAALYEVIKLMPETSQAKGDAAKGLRDVIPHIPEESLLRGQAEARLERYYAAPNQPSVAAPTAPLPRLQTG